MFIFRSKYSVVIQTKRISRLLLTLCLCLTATSSITLANSLSPESNAILCPSDVSGGDNPGSLFSVNGYTFSGEYLVITYTIRYPGMTKVKMFDGSRQLLWRNQYVNDEEGEHKLFLRRKNLGSGNYTFEFDYKNQKQTMNVSI